MFLLRVWLQQDIPKLGWIGSLANTGFQKLSCYWLNNSSIDNIEFSWVIDSELATREKGNNLKYNDTPKAFRYVQSTKQAFISLKMSF